jgi:hypothetical protein
VKSNTYNEEDCAITPERLQQARETAYVTGGSHRDRKSCFLTTNEVKALQGEQKRRKTLLLAAGFLEGVRLGEHDHDDSEEEATAVSPLPQDQVPSATADTSSQPCHTPSSDTADNIQPTSSDNTTKKRRSVGTIQAQFMTAKLRSRLDQENDGVLGILQKSRGMKRYNSLRANPNYIMYNLAKMCEFDFEEDDDPHQLPEKKEMDIQDISYVRKPNLARILEAREAMANHPKYTLRQVVLSRRFHLYAHRFGNAQYQRTLMYPTLCQPREMYDVCGVCKEDESGSRTTEKQRTRDGHRFIIAGKCDIYNH